MMAVSGTSQDWYLLKGKQDMIKTWNDWEANLTEERAIHEVALIWPKMQADEFLELVNDIKVNGLREPIWTHQGEIIDGRNRYHACKEAGVTPTYREWDGNGSLVLFVASLNQHRRHLNSSQKAMVAVEIEKQLSEEARKNKSLAGGNHGNQYTGGKVAVSETFQKAPKPIHAAKEAAKITGTNEHYVIDAKKVIEKAPELRPLVMDCVLSLSDARRLSNVDEGTRSAILGKLATGEAQTLKEAKALYQHEARENQNKVLVVPQSVKLLQGDFNEVVKQIGNDSISLIVTDPPYNISSEREYRFDNRSNISANFGEWDKHAHEDFIALLGEWAKEWYRILKPLGSAYIFTSDDYLSYLIDAMKQAGFHKKNTLVWHKTNPGTQVVKTNYRCSVEYILFCTKGHGGHLFNWQGDEADIMHNHIESPICQGNERLTDEKGYTLHPTQKPESVIRHLVTISSNPGDLIFDGFSGTGTTAKVAYDMGRGFVGIEQDPVFLAASEGRVAS